MTGANENPGALAGAAGAEVKALENLHDEGTASPAARHPIIARHWGALV
ncbi:hypothetical protein Salmuc_02750 [Salipiger mucosus DSM 16094]|uniref:Uncharacterized protein n=1 Tax=Salipiger mucosus DSM 16094 TaxID=1123237 RepID=S9S5A2_9RHOB|nr:hypothetical protein Salmuc_02750 [Salipiger mucosus DSM 16094]